MGWLALIPPFVIGALAVSLVLAAITWSLTTSGHRIETPDGLGGRRTYSRGELAALPPLFIGFDGFLFFAMGDRSRDGFRIIGSLWIVGVLLTQGIVIAAALKRRAGRRKQREALFGA